MLPAGTAQPLGKPSGAYFGAVPPLPVVVVVVAGGGVATPHVAAVLTSRPSRVTTVAASGPSILTTVHPDSLRLGVCRR